MKTALTPEQSQRLIEMGVDPGKASATIVTDDYNESTDNFQHPIFGLTDLLELTPKEIMGIGLGMEYDDELWCVYYNTLFVISRLELIDALYELLCWTLTKEKNEKGKQ